MSLRVLEFTVHGVLAGCVGRPPIFTTSVLCSRMRLLSRKWEAWR